MTKKVDKMIDSLSQLQMAALAETINELKKRRKIISDADDIHMLIILVETFESFGKQIRKNSNNEGILEFSQELFNNIAPSLERKNHHSRK